MPAPEYQRESSCARGLDRDRVLVAVAQVGSTDRRAKLRVAVRAVRRRSRRSRTRPRRGTRPRTRAGRACRGHSRARRRSSRTPTRRRGSSRWQVPSPRIAGRADHRVVGERDRFRLGRGRCAGEFEEAVELRLDDPVGVERGSHDFVSRRAVRSRRAGSECGDGTHEGRVAGEIAEDREPEQCGRQRRRVDHGRRWCSPRRSAAYVVARGSDTVRGLPRWSTPRVDQAHSASTSASASMARPRSSRARTVSSKRCGSFWLVSVAICAHR